MLQPVRIRECSFSFEETHSQVRRLHPDNTTVHRHLSEDTSNFISLGQPVRSNACRDPELIESEVRSGRSGFQTRRGDPDLLRVPVLKVVIGDEVSM